MSNQDSQRRNERPIPEAAVRDSDAVEMLRVWVAEGGLHCSLKIGMYKESMNIDEELAWGKILADVAKHISNALQELGSTNSNDSMLKIRDSFISEIDRPTSTATGEFVRKH
jgi:hypothetical protein